MEIVFIIVGILSIFWIPISIYAIRNLLRKYNRLEDEHNFNSDWINQFKTTIEFLNNRLNEIDRKGTFKSDDEVGIFFDELKKIQTVLNNLFAPEEKS